MKRILDRWERWLQAIYDDMVDQATSRMVFRETTAIITTNPLIPKDSDFLQFLEKWYVDSTVMGLRRQLKVSRDSVSLAGLLQDIAANSALASRERFLGLYPRGDRKRAARVFDKHVGAGLPHIDATAVRCELAELKALAARCEEYADRFVAHRDKRGIRGVPTHEEMNRAIDFSESLLRLVSAMTRKFDMAWLVRGLCWTRHRRM